MFVSPLPLLGLVLELVALLSGHLSCYLSTTRGSNMEVNIGSGENARSGNTVEPRSRDDWLVFPCFYRIVRWDSTNTPSGQRGGDTCS